MEVDAPFAARALPQRRTWLQCRQAVKDSHKGAAELSHRIPQSFSVCEGKTVYGVAARRVYFLSALPGQRENTLVYVDLPFDADQTPATSDVLAWKPMLNQTQKSATKELSREEQLMRERKRIRSSGITSYDYQCYDGCGVFAYSACNSLFICGDQEPNGKFIKVDAGIEATELETDRKTSRMDPKLCPTSPLLLAFVSDADLWVANVQTGREERLTFASNVWVIDFDIQYSTGLWLLKR